MKVVIYEFKTLSSSCSCVVNQELLSFNNLDKHLQKQGFNIVREEMLENDEKSIDNLPMTLINDQVVKKGSYPNKDDFNEWFNNYNLNYCLKDNKKRFGKKSFILLTILSAFLIAILITAIVSGFDGVKAIFNFISNQLLGMRWLDDLVGAMFTKILGSNFMATRWGDAVQFFVYDTIKIIVLLCLLIFSISYIQSYFPPERTKRILGRYKGLGANGVGALLGTVTPFCSCSSIPIFIGFTSAGISNGVTFSFLISSPLIDLGALILLVSIFGIPIGIAYVLVGLLLAIIGGSIIEKTGVGKHVHNFNTVNQSSNENVVELTTKDRLTFAKDGMITTLKKVWIYIIIGVGIGATIHNFIPEAWIQAVLGADKWYSVLVATFAGTPMYADIFGTIPVAQALFAKGVGVGTILSFMMSVTVLSLPSMIMLSKAVKPKLFVTFITIVVTGIIVIGYIFNALNFLFI